MVDPKDPTRFGQNISGRRVLFLDIDGVLQPASNQNRFQHDMDSLKQELATRFNDEGYLLLDKYDVAAVYYDWDSQSVSELKRLLTETNAEIILSSDWRHSKNLDDMRRLFRIHGLDGWLKELVPATGTYSDKSVDIQAYLEAHPGLFFYCVLDDINLDKHFRGHFICVMGYALKPAQTNAVSTILQYGPWWNLMYLESKWSHNSNYSEARTGESHIIHDGIRKVIFLDFDGVLNDDLGTAGDGIAVREEAVKMLRYIVRETDAHIIFSSSRRHSYERYANGTMQETDYGYEDMHAFQSLLEANCLYIAGSTPIIDSGPYARPAEIRSFLSRRPDIEGFVILDDDYFWVWEELEPHFVRTVTPAPDEPDGNAGRLREPLRGLTWNHAEQAVEILNSGSLSE